MRLQYLAISASICSLTLGKLSSLYWYSQIRFPCSVYCFSYIFKLDAYYLNSECILYDDSYKYIIMSALVCSLSGCPLAEPVICKKTGYIFQKSTIEKQIKVYGVCPHTGQPLAAEDIMELKQKDPQIAYKSTDLETLTTKLQSQYDALILEAHFLKNQLGSTRKQLALSLYRQDAATRVISTLKSDVESNKQKISKLLNNSERKQQN